MLFDFYWTGLKYSKEECASENNYKKSKKEKLSVIKFYYEKIKDITKIISNFSKI